MKIGIMGGTFDPIHNGHLMLGKAALRQFGLDEIWFMPNGNPPHKEQTSIQTKEADRIAMTSLAIEGIAGFRLELYETKKEKTSYSYETLEHFHACRKEDRFYFIIGADSLFAIESWKYPERIFPVCTILAACRDEMNTPHKMYSQIDYLKTKYDADIRLLSIPVMNVSSRNIRKAIKEGRSISGYVPEKVENYILEEGLYGTKDH